MPEWQKVETYFNFFGLFLILVFPILVGIPVIGYLVETAALFCVILFSFRRRQILLAIGSMGSILMATTLFGPSLLLIGIWGMIIIPGTIFGKLLAEGAVPLRAFMISLLAMSIGSLIIFWGERELIYKALDEVQGWVNAGLMGNQTTSGSVSRPVEWVDNTIAILKRLMPALLALSGIAQLFVAVSALFFLLGRSGEYVRSFGSFIYWKMPFFCIYLTGLFIFLRLIGAENMKITADNFLLFIGIFYSVFGFSVFEYFLRKVRLTTFLKVLFYVGFLFLQLPGLVLAAVIGLFDSYFDFRNVKAKILG